jgi:hypothetical protein
VRRKLHVHDRKGTSRAQNGPPRLKLNRQVGAERGADSEAQGALPKPKVSGSEQSGGSIVIKAEKAVREKNQ